MRPSAIISRVTAALFVAFVVALLVVSCSDDETPIGPDHDHESLFVLNELSNTLFIYQVPGLHGPDTIPMPTSAPHHLHFNPTGGEYYIVARNKSGLGRAYSLDLETHAVKDSSDFQGLLTGVTTDQTGNDLYISDFGTSANQRTLMWKMDPVTFAVEQEIQCGSQPHYIEVTHDNEIVVVVNAGSDEVTLYYPNGDPQNNVFNVSIHPNPADRPQIGQPKYAPYGLEIADNDSLAYLSCRKANDPNRMEIFVFDLVQRQTVDTIHLDWQARYQGHGDYRGGLAILLENDRYLAVTSQHGNGVYLIDLTDKSYQHVVFSQNWTFGVSATSDEQWLYVTASNDQSTEKGWVYELKRDGGTLTVTDSVQADMVPNGCHVLHAHGHGS
ncbi:MAG: hypothetical protein Kow0074_04130 [Candidatus Zixiibacteriota bacterium]